MHAIIYYPNFLELREIFKQAKKDNIKIESIYCTRCRDEFWDIGNHYRGYCADCYAEYLMSL